MAAKLTPQEAQAYDYCRRLTRRHYENFPVISFILPAELRDPISAIYAFARNADDIADEDPAGTAVKLEKLAHYDHQLDRIETRQPVDEPAFIALAHTIHTHQLPIALFHDLIRAFRQDVTKTRYASLDEVWEYCTGSANPIGRLLLHLNGQDSAQNLSDSDDICSALQLINFLQDIVQDIDENDRIYLPQDLLASFKVSEEQLYQHQNSSELHALKLHLVGIAREKMLRGQRLGNNLRGRFGLQLRVMINGGLRITELLEQEPDAFARPRLHKSDWLRMASRAMFSY